jgi:hypothetical protein
VEARSFGLQLGLVKCRLFWARLGDKLYIASQPYILEELAAKLANNDGASAVGRDVPDLKAHAMIHIRPRRWNQVLPAYRLAWAERHRQACLDNVGRLSSVARVVNAGPAAPAAAPHDPATELDHLAAQLYGLRFYCPEGGSYIREGNAVHCSLHGSALQPRQRAVPEETGASDTLLRDCSDLTVTLTFLEDGLHAVLIIDRN